MRREVNKSVINSKRSIFLRDLLDIFRYAAISVLCISVLGIFLLLGLKLW